MHESLSIVVPAYNESARLGDSLEKIFGFLSENFPGSEVIVVDDGSSDNTIALAEISLARHPSVESRIISVKPNRGKGNAVRLGLLAARSSIALFTDSDLSTPIEEATKLVDAIVNENFDVAFGSRALDRSLIGVHQPWRREQGGRFFNMVVRLATGMPYWDTQCGFKAFRMSAFRPIAKMSRIDRFGFDVEYLYVAKLAGLRMKEIPVRWDHNDGSKLNVVSDTLKAFDEIRTIRKLVKQGEYDGAIKRAGAGFDSDESLRSSQNLQRDEANSESELVTPGTRRT